MIRDARAQLDYEAAFLQATLCLGQSDFWHGEPDEQYLAALHFEQTSSLTSAPPGSFRGPRPQNVQIVPPSCFLRLSSSSTTFHVSSRMPFAAWPLEMSTHSAVLQDGCKSRSGVMMVNSFG